MIKICKNMYMWNWGKSSDWQWLVAFRLKFTQKHKGIHHLLGVNGAIPITIQKCEERSGRIFTLITHNVPSQQPLVEISPANLLVAILVDFVENVSLEGLQQLDLPRIHQNPQEKPTSDTAKQQLRRPFQVFPQEDSSQSSLTPETWMTCCWLWSTAQDLWKLIPPCHLVHMQTGSFKMHTSTPRETKRESAPGLLQLLLCDTFIICTDSLENAAKVAHQERFFHLPAINSFELHKR